jgi:hypothetical protein
MLGGNMKDFELVKKFSIMAILMIMFNLQAFGQGLFDEAVGASAEDETDKKTSYELNGFFRATFYGGKVPGENEAEIKSAYAEAELQLKARKGDMGDALANIRFRNGNEFDQNINEVNLREAYLNAYIGRFDFRIGHQIVVWGRADGFNPTDNITPKDFLVRSQDEDDRRLGNFLVRAWYNAHPIRLEAIWIPNYATSTIPTDIVQLPNNLGIVRSKDFEGENVAFRINFEWPGFDGSVSYFNGFNPTPGLHLVDILMFFDRRKFVVAPFAYRQHIIGADFQTTWGDYGIRSEAAIRYPYKDYEVNDYVPYPDLQYIFSFDREFGSDVSLIMQYMGRYVFDYTELVKPILPLEMGLYQLACQNRLISFQTEEITHAVIFRPAWTFMYETLTIETLGMYNFTTEELMLRPKMSYDIADDLSAIFGGEIYIGPEESLYGSIDSYLSAVYFELRASF